MPDARTAGPRLIFPVVFWLFGLGGSWALIWAFLPPGPVAVSASGVAFAVHYVILLARLGDAYLRYTLLIPAMILLIAVTVIPIGFLTYLAFFRVTILNFRGHWPFVGLANFVKVYFMG